MCPLPLWLSEQGTYHMWLSQQTSLITTIFKKRTFLATLSGSQEHFWQPEWVGFKHHCVIFNFKINTYINIPKPISSSWKVKVFTFSEHRCSRWRVLTGCVEGAMCQAGHSSLQGDLGVGTRLSFRSSWWA